MDLTNEFIVPLDPAETWKVLLDIKRIMPCVPGAELLEVMDGQSYKGKVSVRLGPVALAFVGTARFEELDEGARAATVLAKGSDARGRGAANAVVQFRLEPVADGTRVVVDTNVNLSGSIAQYGRGTGVIQGVASQLTAQFAQNLKAMLARGEVEEEPEPAEAPAFAPASEPAQAVVAPSAAIAPSGQPSAGPAPGFDAVIAAIARAEAAAARVEASVGRVEAAAARVEVVAAALRKDLRPAVQPLPQAKPISGFSLMMTVLWGMITGLFTGKRNG